MLHFYYIIISLTSKKARVKIVVLNDKEQHTFEVIDKVVNGKMTRKEAQFELDKSRQQIYRLILIYFK